MEFGDRPNMVASFLCSKNQGEKSMTEERDCIFCWESDEPETLQPLFPGPGALSDGTDRLGAQALS